MSIGTCSSGRHFIGSLGRSLNLHPSNSPSAEAERDLARTCRDQATSAVIGPGSDQLLLVSHLVDIEVASALRRHVFPAR